jgi:hypothetical protein
MIFGSICASPSGFKVVGAGRITLHWGVFKVAGQPGGNLPKSLPCAVHGDGRLPGGFGLNGHTGPDCPNAVDPAKKKRARMTIRIPHLHATQSQFKRERAFNKDALPNLL